MVREAVEDDLRALIPLMRQCHADSVDYNIPFCADTAREVSLGLIERENSTLLTNGSAFLALVIAPYHFNAAYKVALELGFYGPAGGELIEAGKVWARERHALRLIANNENTSRSKAMGRWYRRHGMEPRATSYEARLWE